MNSKKFWDVLTTIAGIAAAAATAVNAVYPTKAGTIVQAGSIGVLGYGSNKVRTEQVGEASSPSTPPPALSSDKR